MNTEAQTYKRLIDIGLALSREKDIQSLLERILVEAKTLVNADAGILYLQKDHKLQFTIVLNDTLGIAQGGNSGSPVQFADLPLSDAKGLPNMADIATLSANCGETLMLDNVYEMENVDPAATQVFAQRYGYESRSFLTVPLKNFAEETIGVLQLINAKNATGKVVPFLPESRTLIEALSSQASVALENRSLLDAQTNLQKKLEREVDERTEELKNALSRLSEAHITLKELTTIDAVTGIRNRKFFDDIFLQEWRRAERQRYPITLMLLDIDHFKSVNDTYGHLAGDECLTKVAHAIDGLFNRPSDLVARYGGEEFAVVLPYIEEEKAAQKAEQVRSHIENMLVNADGQKLSVTISIGRISAVPGVGYDPRSLLAMADRALYQAKAEGRNRVCRAAA